MWGLTPVYLQYVLVIIVNLNVLNVGMGLAWPSPVLVKLKNVEESPLQEPITDEQGSWIVSLGSLIGIIGLFLASYLANNIGRKYTVVLASVPRIVGSLLLTLADRVWMIYIGRILFSLSDVFVFCAVPMYVSEIANKEIRGSLGTFLQIFSSVGIVITLCVGPYVDYVTLNSICTCVSIAGSIPSLFLLDSPYFLFKKGKKSEAINTLILLRGSEVNALEEVKEYEESENKEAIKMIDVIKSKAVMKALGISITISIGSQATGFNAVTFYLQSILVSTNTSVSSEAASAVIGMIQLLASFCTTVVTDRFGRKPIVCTSLVGMAIGLIGLGAFFELRDPDVIVDGVLQYLPLLSLILVVYFYSAGLGSLIWPLLSELFEGSVRALGVTSGLVMSIIMIFLSTRFFAPLTKAIGAAATYWIFSLNSLALCMFILFCVPETKDRSFSEIQAALAGPDEVSGFKEGTKL